MTAPNMMKVEYEEIMARAALLERPIGSGIPTEIPKPPCTLALVLKATKVLADGAEDMRKYLAEFDTVRLTLAQSLRNAAKAYRRVDEDAAEALRNETPVPGAALLGSVGDTSRSGMLGAGALGAGVDPTRDEIIDGLHSVEDIAWQLEQPDQGASFNRFADQWAKHREQLRLAARERFDPFREWEGDAASTVFANFEAQRKWLETMVTFYGQLADQAEEKRGFETATSDAFDMFGSILKIKMVTVQVNGDEMAWVCENLFGAEPNVQSAYSIETFAWDQDGNLLIKTYYPMPENVGADSDPYAHLLESQQEATPPG